MLPNNDLIKYFFSDNVISAYPKPYYNNFIGAIVVMPLDIMIKVNGYTNKMYGWGAEDDNLYLRLKHNNITPYNVNSGKVVNLEHTPSNRNFNIHNKKINKDELNNNFNSGLSDLKYTITSQSTINNIPKFTVDF
jgi:hypothetical protein